MERTLYDGAHQKKLLFRTINGEKVFPIAIAPMNFMEVDYLKGEQLAPIFNRIVWRLVKHKDWLASITER